MERDWQARYANLLESRDSRGTLATVNASEAAGLAAESYLGARAVGTLCGVVPGFVGAFLSVRHGRHGDRPLRESPGAHAALFFAGGGWIPRRVYLALLPGQEGRRSLFSQARGRARSAHETLGRSKRICDDVQDRKSTRL